jgi:hypothetical protein
MNQEDIPLGTGEFSTSYLTTILDGDWACFAVTAAFMLTHLTDKFSEMGFVFPSCQLFIQRMIFRSLRNLLAIVKADDLSVCLASMKPSNTSATDIIDSMV